MNTSVLDRRRTVEGLRREETDVTTVELPSVGDSVLVVDPDGGACYTIRVDAVDETPAGPVVTGAVRFPRRARGRLITTRLPS